jgi:methionyl aminopeptidase
MTTMSMAQIEGVGANYDQQELMEVRSLTRQAVHAIAKVVSVGMPEEDCRSSARKILSAMGMRRGWHHIITRVGPNTTKDFMEQSERGVVLGENDIFFVDIGPIYGDCEGDAGDTFVVGDDPEHHKAKEDVRDIWEEVRAMWFETGACGRELYEFARSTTQSRGWKLNMDLSGHRLCDFPHSAHYDGPLAEVGFRPNPNLWVLEIAIAHPNRKFGAFYEDMLLEDQSFPDWVFTEPPTVE